ncbi:MAG: hypothetical protein WC301_07455 [Candidatus Omnitrophota bacterium]|jgi:phage gpG-like protein
MINISYSFSNDYRNYFTQYPYLFEKMKTRASKRVLEMWQQRAFVRAPYKTGTLRREIKALYNERILVAGQFLSRDYALIQDVGGRAGRNRSAYIRPKHYFFRMAEESEPEVIRIYEEEVEKIIR